MIKNVKYIIAFSLAILTIACSKEDNINSTTVENNNDLKFTVKSNEPVPDIRYEANLISVSETGDCFTYQINIILLDGGKDGSIAYSTIMHSGSGCKDEGVGSATNSVDGTGLYNGDVIEKDFLINGKTMVSHWETYPTSYAEYVKARDLMISRI